MNKIKECVKNENHSHGFMWMISNYKMLTFLLIFSVAWSLYSENRERSLTYDENILFGLFAFCILSFGCVINFIPSIICRLIWKKKIRFSVSMSCLVAVIGWVLNALYHAFFEIHGVFPMFVASVCSYKILRSRYGMASIGFYCRKKSIKNTDCVIKDSVADCRISDDVKRNEIKSITLYKKYKKHFHVLPVLNFILIIFFSVAFYIDFENKFIKTFNRIESTKKESMKYVNKENEEIRSELSDIKIELNNFISKSERHSAETRDGLDELTRRLNEFEKEMDSNSAPQEKEVKLSGFNETDKERIVKLLSEYIKAEETGDLPLLRRLYFDEVDYYINDYAITAREGAVEESQRNWEKWTTRNYKINSWSGNKIGADSYIIDLELNYTFSSKKAKEEGRKNIVLILDYINKELGISAFREINTKNTEA